MAVDKEGMGRQTAVFLSLILLLAAGLRLYGLETQSLWNDELSSWRRSQFADLETVMQEGVLTDVHPPLYTLFLYAWQRVAGDGAWQLRLPSAVFGIVTVFATFLLGRRIYTEQEGLVAAGFTAVLWCPIYYSQEGRPYALLLLLAVLTTYFWIPAFTSPTPSRQDKVWYVITAVFTIYLHYYGLFLVILQAATACLLASRSSLLTLPHSQFTIRQSLFTILPPYLLIFLSYLPWLPAFIEDLQTDTTWIQPPRVDEFGRFLRFFFNQSYDLLYLALAFYAFLLLKTVYQQFRVSSFKFQVSSSKFQISRSPALLLAVWLLLPFLLVYLKSTLSTPILTHRNLIICLPPAYLLLARAMTQLPIRPFFQSLTACAVAAFFLFNLVAEQAYYTQPHKEQFREVVQYMVEREAQFPEAIVVGHAHFIEYLDYYFEKQGSPTRVTLLAGETADLPALTAALQTHQPHYIWLIAAHLQPEPQFLENLQQHMTLLDHQEFLKASVWLFEIPQ